MVTPAAKKETRLKKIRFQDEPTRPVSFFSAVAQAACFAALAKKYYHRRRNAATPEEEEREGLEVTNELIGD